MLERNRGQLVGGAGIDVLMQTGLLACRFANALINANARRIGYVAPGSVKLIRDACLPISTFF